MKRARADRILWDVGRWLIRWSATKRKSVKVWRSRIICTSRRVARGLRLEAESVRRFEGSYIGSGE